MYDIVVIGAGVVGGMIARELAKYDLSICILEKENDVAMGATKANSAIVHAGFDAKVGSLKAKMNVRGSVLMESVAEQLGVKYRRNGSLVVAFENERAEVEEIYERGIKNGVDGLRIIEHEELLAMEPNLNPELSCALYAPTGAIVCPYELCIAAVGNAMDNGAELCLNFEVSSIEKKAEGYYLITAADGREVLTKYIINSAGLYSDEVAKMTGDCDFTVHPRRGEYMILDKECGAFVDKTIFHTPTKMGKGILVSPTVDNNLLLGPTAEDMEDKEDKSVTAEGYARIIKGACDNAANIPFNKVITSFCGLRSVGSTGDFIIKMREGVVTLGGIESPGLTSAPAIAEYVAGLLGTNGVTLNEKQNYIATRKPAHAFREMTMEEKNQVIKKDNRYGRIVCRCEGITEGEIVEAIHTNPGATDVDGIKRRTRSGMGRCQGGFCSPIVVDILARELGKDLEDITKFGKGSVINYAKTKGDC